MKYLIPFIVLVITSTITSTVLERYDQNLLAGGVSLTTTETFFEDEYQPESMIYRQAAESSPTDGELTLNARLINKSYGTRTYEIVGQYIENGSLVDNAPIEIQANNLETYQVRTSCELNNLCPAIFVFKNPKQDPAVLTFTANNATKSIEVHGWKD